MLCPDGPDQSGSQAASALGSIDRKVLQRVHPGTGMIGREPKERVASPDAHGLQPRKDVGDEPVKFTVTLPGGFAKQCDEWLAP